MASGASAGRRCTAVAVPAGDGGAAIGCRSAEPSAATARGSPRDGVTEADLGEAAIETSALPISRKPAGTTMNANRPIPAGPGRSDTPSPCRWASLPTTNSPIRRDTATSTTGGSASRSLIVASSAGPSPVPESVISTFRSPPGHPCVQQHGGAGSRERCGVLQQLRKQVHEVGDDRTGHLDVGCSPDPHPLVLLDLGHGGAQHVLCRHRGVGAGAVIQLPGEHEQVLVVAAHAGGEVVEAEEVVEVVGVLLVPLQLVDQPQLAADEALAPAGEVGEHVIDALPQHRLLRREPDGLPRAPRRTPGRPGRSPRGCPPRPGPRRARVPARRRPPSARSAPEGAAARSRTPSSVGCATVATGTATTASRAMASSTSSATITPSRTAAPRRTPPRPPHRTRAAAVGRSRPGGPARRFDLPRHPTRPRSTAADRRWPVP